MSINMQVCQACGQSHYPPALLCFHCGSSEFRSSEVAGGRVIARTDVAYQVGGDPDETIWLGVVQTDAVTRVIARLTEPAYSSDHVLLELSGNVLLAKPA